MPTPQFMEPREKDLETVQIAGDSFSSIQNFVQNLNNNLKTFDKIFIKKNQYLIGLKLNKVLPRKEHSKLSIHFMDRTLFGIRSKLNAKAVRNWKSLENTDTKNYVIHIYFNAPREVLDDPQEYNQWFVNNLMAILSDNKIRSSYVHEFIHILDYQRINQNYLVQRTLSKQQSDNKKHDFDKYINDPLELNAYFEQGISDVVNLLNVANTKKEKMNILGLTPQKFVEKFMTSYLKKTFRKNISADNHKRIMKRTAVIYDKLIELF